MFISIIQIGNTKSRDGKMTMLHFLAKTIEKKHPELLGFMDEMTHADRAARGNVFPYYCNYKTHRAARGNVFPYYCNYKTDRAARGNVFPYYCNYKTELSEVMCFLITVTTKQSCQR